MVTLRETEMMTLANEYGDWGKKGEERKRETVTSVSMGITKQEGWHRLTPRPLSVDGSYIGSTWYRPYSAY